MSWKESLEEIRSVEFDVGLNVASSTNGYFRAVSLHPTVQEAYGQIFDSAELREDAMGLICDLANEEVDLEFENPNDTPLAVLLWLTNFTAPDSAQVAATYVDRAPHCWYAKKLAQRILDPPPSVTANYTFSQEPDEAIVTRSYLKTIRLTMPLMSVEPLEVHGSTSPTQYSGVSTIWEGPSAEGVVPLSGGGQS